MDIPEGYRSTHINRIEYEETTGRLKAIQADYQGVSQLHSFDPYQAISGATIGWSAGVNTLQLTSADHGLTSASDVVVSKLHGGSWIAISNVNFGEDGASGFTALLSNQGEAATLELRLDREDGPIVGKVAIPSTSEAYQWNEQSTAIAGSQGTHDLYIVLQASSDHTSAVLLQEWKFERVK
ncbi:carbohydrate-binding protein [Bacillales bacterium AN1005]